MKETNDTKIKLYYTYKKITIGCSVLFLRIKNTIFITLTTACIVNNACS